MKLTATREDILTPLQSVIGVVERRQTMPVLANVLLSARDDKLSITGTDLEVELVATSSVSVQMAGDVTVPGRKLLDIFKALPEKTSVTLTTEGDRVSLKGGRSRFTLSTLPAAEFPLVDEINAQQTLTVSQGEFRRLIDKTHFSMAQQDVRYYLNGLLLETEGKSLRAVATDGHRLALCETELETQVPRPPSRSSSLARACSSCSAFWVARETWSWRSEPTTFEPRSAIFASLPSSLTAVSRNMGA